MTDTNVFSLLNNTGEEESILNASKILFERIKEISDSKRNSIKKQLENELASRNISVDGNEFMRLFNSRIKSVDMLPSVRDIEHTHLVTVGGTYKPYVATSSVYLKSPFGNGTTTASFGTTVSSKINGSASHFISDCVIYIKLTGLSAVSALDKVRWVEFPGHRIAEKVTMKISDKKVEEYTYNKYNQHYQFNVSPSQELAYLKMIGQQTPIQGSLTADPTVDEVSECRFFFKGAQTFKRTQPTLELFIPVLTWFREMKSALPVYLLGLNSNKLEIELKLAEVANMVSYANYGGGGSYVSPTISECSLYTNHTSVSPKFHEIFAKMFKFQLLRVTLEQVKPLKEKTGSVKIEQIKWPIECLYVAFRPVSNLSSSQIWTKNLLVTSNTYESAVVTGASTISVNNSVFYVNTPVVSTVGLFADNQIRLFGEYPEKLYSSYYPYKFCGPNMKSPDNGWFMFNFSKKLGDYQPTGSFNFSKYRECYLSYRSEVNPNTGADIISESNPVEVIIIADAINFLISTGNDMSLRYM